MSRPDGDAMIVGITGATGYIGRHLTRAALAAGCEVHIFARTDPKLPGVHFHPFDLQHAKANPLPDMDVLFHLAAVTAAGGTAGSDTEVQAARALLAALPSRCRFVFLSSQVASERAPSSYGRTKARIEEVVLARGGVVVRAGLVYGGMEAGLWGSLSRACARLRLLPAFVAPVPIVQPIHVDDLTAILFEAAKAEPGIVSAAGQPVTFTDFLRTVARERHRRRPFFLAVPITAFAMGARAVETVWRRPLGSERLLSLARNTRMEPAAGTDRLRRLDEGLARSPKPPRHKRIAEGAMLMRYLLKAQPRLALLRRYAREAEARDWAAILPPHSFAKFAIMGADRGAASDPALRERLLLALRICEASPQGYQRMLAPAQIGRNRASRMIVLVRHLSSSAVFEMAGRLLRPLVGPGRRHLMSCAD